ncbi:helix-turn-helix transcriptional regulator [Sphingobium sp. CR2-8]|uniref:helix-turn-helix transcriptional regulator n=1 Tax=Sphingobium sp. CR2-8 TaxID=1306534 RepID=UPI002DBFB0FE|nr:helix-turn-helix transcriptional regulator [Sphingobium sp. CR2-8]MEC3911902.1 helix-turn-helix transcriptional regulator [Sphingobium sp. CR2-8]
MPVEQDLPLSTGQLSLHSLIDSIGDDCFASQLLLFLNEICGAEYCAIFRLEGTEPVGLAAASLDGSDTARQFANSYIESELWRSDPSMTAARFTYNHVHPSLISLDVQALENQELRNFIYPHVGHRVLVCGRSTIGHIALSILRKAGGDSFGEEDISHLEALASPLLSIVGKHVSATWQRQRLVHALSSLQEIEQCIALAPEALPRREAQVCSRILLGVSTIGIALELGVGEETVMTYRKRVYHRLGIATQRELLMWYVGLWSEAESMPRDLPFAMQAKLRG